MLRRTRGLCRPGHDRSTGERSAPEFWALTATAAATNSRPLPVVSVLHTEDGKILLPGPGWSARDAQRGRCMATLISRVFWRLQHLCDDQPFPWLSESLVARDDTTQSFHSLADEGWLGLLTNVLKCSMQLWTACSSVGGGPLM